jgi:hypothetical protein
MSTLATTVTTRHRSRLLVPVIGLLLLTAACGSSSKVADVVSTSTTMAPAATTPAAGVTTPSPSTTVATTPAAQVASVEVISADVDRSLSDVDTALAAIDQDASDTTKNGD